MRPAAARIALDVSSRTAKGRSGTQLSPHAVLRVGPGFSLRSAGMTARVGTRWKEARGFMRTIDIHSHVLTEDTMALIGKEVPALKPKLTRMDAENFIIDVAGTPYKPFPRG